MLLVHIWEEPNKGICVYTVHDGDMRWRIWLGQRDARKRRFHNAPAPGYWVMDYEEQGPLVAFFNSASSWQIVTDPPPHFYTRQPSWEPAEKTTGQTRSRTRTHGKGSATLSGKTPYAELYLLPTAPKNVVDAVYKVMMREHHSDHGGSDEIAKRLNEIKETIYKERGW